MKKAKKREKFRGIRVSLIGAFAIPVILIAALGIVSYQRALKGIADNYEKTAMDTVKSAGSYFDVMYTFVSSSVNQLAGNDKLKERPEYGENKGVHKAIISTLTSDEFMNQIHILSSQEIGISTKAGVVRQDMLKDFLESDEGKIFTKSSKNSVWVGKHEFLDQKLGTKQEDYGIAYIKKLSNNTGKAYAYIIADVGTRKIQEALTDLTKEKGNITGFITSDGREILGKRSEEKVFLSQNFYKSALKDTDTSGSGYVTYKGSSYLFLYSKVEKSGGMVCELIPKAVIIKKAGDIRIITIGFVVAACIIAVITVNNLAAGIGRAVKLLTKEFSKVSSGNLTGNIDVKRKDEFALLADEANHMIGSMKVMLKKAAGTGSTAAVSAGEMAFVVKGFHTSAKEITKAIGDIEEGVVQQVCDTAGCLEQISVLSEKVGRVYENTGEIERDVKGTMAITEKGLSIVDDLGTSARATTEITGKVISNIEELSKKSEDIETIVSAINAIAGQTTLLSLNASIEASRAGSFGQGFGVVAEEIRVLAERSLQASKNITEIIKDIQASTGETAHTAKEAQDIVKGQTEAIHRTIDSFHDISSHIEHLNQSLTELTSGIQEIEETKRETYNALENISSVVSQTAAAAGQINDSAGSQLRAAEELDNAAVKLREDITILDKTLSSFIL